MSPPAHLLQISTSLQLSQKDSYPSLTMTQSEWIEAANPTHRGTISVLRVVSLSPNMYKHNGRKSYKCKYQVQNASRLFI